MNFFKELHTITAILKFINDANLIFESIQQGQQPDIAPFARDLFEKFIPGELKTPVGTVSEEAFINAIFDIFQLFLKPQKNTAS